MVVGFLGASVIGVMVTIVLTVLTGSGLALLLGLVVWVATTGYLATRGTVQSALSKTAYGLAVAVLLVPLIAFGPSDNPTDFGSRIVIFPILFGGAAILAGIIGGIGLGLSKLLPDDNQGS